MMVTLGREISVNAPGAIPLLGVAKVRDDVWYLRYVADDGVGQTHAVRRGAVRDAKPDRNEPRIECSYDVFIVTIAYHDGFSRP